LAEPVAALIVALAGDYTHIVAPATTDAKNILPRVAALLDVMVLTDVSTIVDADIAFGAHIDEDKIDWDADSGTFVEATTCPAGNNDGAPCDEAPPGTFCEYDGFGTANLGLDGALDNCGSYDWYFRSR
jgi:hypothetical protein